MNYGCILLTQYFKSELMVNVNIVTGCPIKINLWFLLKMPHVWKTGPAFVHGANQLE